MIKDKKFIYVASPFSHEDEKVRDKRVEDVEKFVAYLQCKYASKNVIFSPIVHSGHVSKYILDKEFHTFDFWIHEIDEYFLELTDELWIFQIDGWYESRGVKWEIRFAEKEDIPIILWRKEGNTYLRHTVC